MTDLFNSPVILINSPSRDSAYQITDPQGAPLANAATVDGKKRTAFQRFFNTGPASASVVQVSRPDNVPLFFVDRPAGQPQASAFWVPSCSLIAPNGALIGRVEHNRVAAAQSYMAAGGRGGQQAYSLLDAQGRPLCDVTGEQTRVESRSHSYDSLGNVHTNTEMSGGRFFIYTDMNQTQIARMDYVGSDKSYHRALQLQFKLPDPLQVLVIASPIAFDLMHAAVFE